MAFKNAPWWISLQIRVPTCLCGIRHGITSDLDTRLKTIRTALTLLLVLFLAQWAIGHWSGSLALQADAGHLFSDVLALAVTLSAIWLAKRPADDRATFGHQRVEILAALLNGLSLLGISGWIIHESLSRWQSPQDVLSAPMLLGSLLGLSVNSVNLVILSQENQQNLNLKAAFLHTASDLANSVGALIAGITIHLWHCLWIDTCIALMVAGLTIVTALPLLKDSLEIFLEYAPATIDVKSIRKAVLNFPEVEQINSLKLWSLTQESMALCLKIQVSIELSPRDRDQVLKRLEAQLRQSFQIDEITIQISSSLPQQALGVHPIFQQSLLEKVLTS
jgi:cobalt-zinc-cadmium efflux system protein